MCPTAQCSLLRGHLRENYVLIREGVVYVCVVKNKRCVWNTLA